MQRAGDEESGGESLVGKGISGCLMESQKERQSLGGAGGDRDSGGVGDLSVLPQPCVKLWDEWRVCICSHLALCPVGVSE